MKRLSLDAAPPAVREFVASLPLDPDGVELEMNGHIVCKVLGPSHLLDAEKQALIKERWELIRRAQVRNKGVPARVLEREVQDAVEEVRRRRRG